jgi:hypothetical protein
MKIGIFSKNNNFMDNIFEELERRGHELVHYAITRDGKGLLTGDASFDRAHFVHVMNNVDVAYVEFIEDLAQDVAMWKYIARIDTPVVMRLHRIELYEPFVRRIPWNVVNDLIFVAPHCQAKFNEWITKSAPIRDHVIENGYDSTLFAMPANRVFRKKMIMAGNIYWKKGHHEMIEFMSTQAMKDWHLEIVGDLGQQQGQEYWMNCLDAINMRQVENQVTYGPKVSRSELMQRFAENSVIISASLEEGTHCVIAEGMLTGLYPLVRHWPGADGMYPTECIWNNFDELRDKLQEWASFTEHEKMRASMHFRLWVEKRYDYEGQARKVAKVIEDSV